MLAAARNGTLSKRRAFAQPAHINGNGRRACSAADGQSMKIGMLPITGRYSPWIESVNPARSDFL